MACCTRLYMDCVRTRDYRNHHVITVTLKEVRNVFIAVGELTEKAYAEGKTKAELMRKLNKKYPYQTSKKQPNTLTEKSVFPEALIIIRGMK